MFYHKGSRSLTLYHVRIRNVCSNLNADLYNNPLRENGNCDCQTGIENAEHYFFHCHLFQNQRITPFRETRQYHPLNAKTLLIGKENLIESDNLIIFTSVQKFIKNTKRFQTGH